MKILLIDNYDSFTYNLYHYLSSLKCNVDVYRNDKIKIDKIIKNKYRKIVISPGPGNPDQAGSCLRIVKYFYKFIPILGVCLGCQGLAYVVSGATVIESDEPFHGRSSDIYHTQTGLFKGVPSPFKAGRYHSLQITEPIQTFTKTAWTKEGIVMGIAHHIRPIWGVQFHPESILSEYGKQIMTNFFTEARNYTSQKGSY